MIANKYKDTPGYTAALQWFDKQGWKAFPFQEEAWQAYLSGKDGLLNAPTGSGKTLALFMPSLIEWINRHPDTYKTKTNNGLQLLWITPLRALTKDIKKSLQAATWDMDVPWLVKIRTGDTGQSEKEQMKKKPPEVLITTPECLHVMLAQKNYADTFKNLQAVVADEWHELLGGKRGVQVELALSRLRAICPGFRSWCISATVGNLEQALEVMTGKPKDRDHVIVKAEIEKLLNVQTVLPPEIERFPWSGHLGLNMAGQLIPILEESRSTLIFTNTRGQSEIWYKKLLDIYPELAGNIAIHHGSLDREVRDWVEDAIHEGRLKVVVCTSSLDLGVDFAPVETVIQIGSPKGVSRFLQRAGRSGHRPGIASNIYFLPTNSLELLEAAGLKEAIKQKIFEDRTPFEKPFDVLVQYLVTLAVSDGFDADTIYKEVKGSYAYRNITPEEWEAALDFISTGGATLKEYNEFQKVDKIGSSFYKVTQRRVALRHRLSMGTIVSDPMMRVQFLRGSSLGSIEESFISKLLPGNIFWFAGRPLEFLYAREMVAYVKKTTRTSGVIPSWMGGRMSLSTQLAHMVRIKLQDYLNGKVKDVEIKKLRPLLKLQKELSAIPREDELLIEKVKTNEGYHIFIFPFAGRSIHEGLSALIAFRLAQRQPLTFSIAMNDYGFELLSDEDVDIEHAIKTGLFETKYLREDILQSVNGTEMARRKFREIAQISGLLFTGYPGASKKNKHLQASSSLLFDVFRDYDPDNLLIRQAYDEVFRYQLDEAHLYELLVQAQNQKILMMKPERPTPFAFPIMVDRLREKLTSETIEDRVRKLQIEFGG